MTKNLAKIVLFAWVPFVLAIGLDGSSSQDFADALYMLTGLIWLIAGTWLSISVLNDK